MTTTRHPAPSGCRKEPRVLSLRNSNTEPTKRMPAGISATSALDNVAFITRLDDELLVRHGDIITTATSWGLGLRRGSWASKQKKLDPGTDSKVHTSPE